MSYVHGRDRSDRQRRDRLEVNEPLRLPGANVYLLGHGYAPVMRYTDRYGVSQTAVAPFLPDDEHAHQHGVASSRTRTSTRPAPTPIRTLAKHQIGFAGVYLPTVSTDASDGQLSVFPAERNPVLVLTPTRATSAWTAASRSRSTRSTSADRPAAR